MKNINKYNNLIFILIMKEMYIKQQKYKPIKASKPLRTYSTIFLTRSCPVKLIDSDSLETVAIFIPSSLSKRHISTARKFIRYKGSTSSRCAYAGLKRSRIPKNERHKLKVKRKVNSSILGYIMPYLKVNPVPQISSTTKKDMNFYKKEVRDLYLHIDDLLKIYMEEEYTKQCDLVRNVPDSVKIGSLNTNVMVNVDHQAHFHKDSGNLNRYGTIIAVSKDETNPFTGYEFVLGDYRVAVPLLDSDILIVDQNRWHGNFSPLKNSGSRISLVGFINNRITNYYNRIEERKTDTL